MEAKLYGTAEEEVSSVLGYLPQSLRVEWSGSTHARPSPHSNGELGPLVLAISKDPGNQTDVSKFGF